VVLEPRSNTLRRNVLQDALARSLSLADQVVIAAIFKSEAIPEVERLDLNQVINEIQQRGKQARILADADAIVNAIAPELQERDVVAILSNGGFGGIYEKLPQRLRGLSVKPVEGQTLGVKN
jgi:UDP-N-acetylmuramate: L-alanyl-gamma-D-glutamyl-meso-diaminopimelate ligase